MNYKIRDRQEMLIRVVRFAKEYADDLPPVATALIPAIAANVEHIESLRRKQVASGGVFGSAAAMRRELARELRQKLVDLAQTGRILARKGRPGLADQLRLGKKMSYGALEAAGLAFVQVLTPLKDTYIARGFRPTFLDEIGAHVAKLKSALEMKFGGLNQRIESTIGLAEAAANGVELVRDLDAMLSPQLRETSPTTYQVWKTTLRLRNRPTRRTSGEKMAAPSLPEGSNPRGISASEAEEGDSVRTIRDQGSRGLEPEEGNAGRLLPCDAEGPPPPGAPERKVPCCISSVPIPVGQLRGA